MRYDLVPMKRQCRGMGRGLTVCDFGTKPTGKAFEDLLELYFKYIDEISQNLPSPNGLLTLINFYNELKKYDIQCEIIAYDRYPLNEVYNYPVEFLGVDVVHDMCESLLDYAYDNEGISQYLNENGLCVCEKDVNKVIPFLDHSDVEWLPCYVYKIIV